MPPSSRSPGDDRRPRPPACPVKIEVARQQLVVLRQEVRACAATSQIMSARSPCCRSAPLTSSQILPARRMPDRRDRMDRPDRRRLRERLADVPRPLLLAHVVLQVAPRHVETDRVAPDDVERVARREPHAARADRDDQLDLVVVVLRRQRIADAPDRRRHDRHDGVGRLGEEERRLLRRVAAHLLRVLGVVAARRSRCGGPGKRSVAAGDRHGRQVPGGNGVIWSLRSASGRCDASSATASQRLTARAHSASGCRAGAASANAGSAGTRRRCAAASDTARGRASTRRALASCGTRQTSASVGASPWQNAPVAGSRASRVSSASRPTSHQ